MNQPKHYLIMLSFLSLFALNASAAYAQSNWYASWGYSGDTWGRSDIHVKQGALNNDFTIHDVSGGDDKQWNSDVFGKGLTVPQYNIRVGRYLDPQHKWAVEFSLDHTKYNTDLGQISKVTGKIDGKPVNKNEALNKDFFDYKLHNGANHIMINIVRRLGLIGTIQDRHSLSAVFKAGAGIMLPHAENTVMGNKNDVGNKTFSNAVGFTHGWWQLNGWTVGGEAGLQYVVYKPVYIELADKVAYADMWNIPVYEGRAKQKIWVNIVSLSLGVLF
jgi:hypothetical protein